MTKDHSDTGISVAEVHLLIREDNSNELSELEQQASHVPLLLSERSLQLQGSIR